MFMNKLREQVVKALVGEAVFGEAVAGMDVLGVLSLELETWSGCRSAWANRLTTR